MKSTTVATALLALVACGDPDEDVACYPSADSALYLVGDLSTYMGTADPDWDRCVSRFPDGPSREVYIGANDTDEFDFDSDTCVVTQVRGDRVIVAEMDFSASTARATISWPDASCIVPLEHLER